MSDLILSILPTVIGPVLCSAVSGILSFLAARHQCRKEIEKLKLEWEHQQSLRSEQGFAQMVELVNAQFEELEVNPKAVTAVMVERSKASGAYALALDDLISVVQSTQFIRIPSTLQKVIETRPGWLVNKK